MIHMSSRERLLTAFHCQEPDHVPLIFNSFGFEPPAHLSWTNEVEEAQRWLSIGVDATLSLHLPLVFHPDVKVRSWEEDVQGEGWPLMVKEYETPVGVLRQEVYRTDDWVSPEWPGHKEGPSEIRLLDDYNIPRSRRFAVENEADLDKLRYLLHSLSDEDIAGFRARADERTRESKELGVVLESIASMGTDMATWLCGVDGMLYMALDKPDMFSALLDLIQEYDKRSIELLLDTPVDLIIRRGWYEGAAFWSPVLYRQFFAPRIKELVHMVHQGGRLMGYIMSTGFMPLLDILVELGYDVHYYIDPVQGGAGVDLGKVKRTFADRIAIVGGINSAVTLEQGTREEIRQAVFDAVGTLGPHGGFVLSPVDCISASTPWESLEIMMEAWREVRDYPVAIVR